MLFSDDSRFVSFAITQRKPRVRVIVPESERRRSGRERVAINYAEKYGLDDEEDVAAARAARRGGVRPKETEIGAVDRRRLRARRFSVGARVYDSELGVTCHWCRQKTVETHVFCTAEACGKGRRAPLAFCGMCLRNRHGEDVDAAVASGIWKCPRCRGSCGVGCVTCCNCGPCRKAHGLAPTHQVIQLARGAGFDNVHDYLVHGATGLTPALLARKRSFNWGKWLAKGFEPPAPATTRASEAAVTATPETTPEKAKRASRTSRVEDVAAELRSRRAGRARGEGRRRGRLGVRADAVAREGRARSRAQAAWAAAIGAMAETTMPSMPTSRPASPATPEADAGAGARESRARASRRVAPFEGALPGRAPARSRRRGRRARSPRVRETSARCSRRARGRARRARAPREPRD